MTDRNQGSLDFHARAMLAATDQRVRDFHGRMLARIVHARRAVPQPERSWWDDLMDMVRGA